MQRSKHVRRTRQCGWTMLELLASMALAALVTVAVMGVLGSLAAERQLLLREASVTPWKRPLADQLRWDVLHSDRYAWRPRRLTLSGVGSRDPHSGAPLHRPCEVTYAVVSQDGRQRLLRSERQLDEATNRPAKTELVASGIEEILLTPWTLETESSSLSVQARRKRRQAEAEETSSGTIPDRLRVSLWGATSEVGDWETVVFRR